MGSMIVYPLAVLAIAQAWVVYSRWRSERHEKLRERVALMLWTAAEESEFVSPGNLLPYSDLTVARR